MPAKPKKKRVTLDALVLAVLRAIRREQPQHRDPQLQTR